MRAGRLKGPDDLSEESSAYLHRFEQLEVRSPNDPDCAQLVREIHQWLLHCVAHARFLPTGSSERRTVRTLVDAWNSRLRREGHRLEGIDDLSAFDPNAGVVLEGECPYPGLEAYREERSHSFYGRGELSARYAQHLVDSRIFLIIGASGSGKSSLALAGVRPRLRASHPEWLYASELTPGAAPLAALAGAVAEAGGKAEAGEELAQALRNDPAVARTRIAQWCQGRPLMLVVDQCEELVTLCRDPAEQAAFGAALVALSEPATEVDGWACYVLLTLRTDHLARFDSSDALKPLFVRLVDEHNSELLTTLDFAEIKRAIAEPAKAVGLRFVPPRAVDDLASQTAGLANGLPLLQFALRRLWDTRPVDPETGKPLDFVTQAMVDALPDVQRSLGTVAEGIFAELTARQREICQRILLELVLLDENFEDPLRRRRNRDELLEVLQSRFPGAKEDITEVEQQFTKAGLLRRFGEGSHAQIEVTHEALLRNWKRISEALSGAEAKRRLHLVKQIQREALEWSTHERREDFLKQQGEPLRSAQTYLADGWLAEAESQAYVEACAEQERTKAKRAAEAKLAKQREKEAREAARIAQVERAKAETERAKSETERVKAETEGASAKAQRALTLWVLAATGAIAVAIGLGAWLRNQASDTARNALLTTIASLGERLPPWEALDVTYNVAKNAGPDFRFVGGHALERMDNAWLLGARDSSLFPVGDGSALLQIDQEKGGTKLLIYLIDANGKPSKKPMTPDLGEDSDRLLALAQVGPAIEKGALQGRRLLVVIWLPLTGGSEYLLKAYLFASEGSVTPLEIKGDMTALQGAEELSPIRIHPDGRRAIWSAINYRKLTNDIQELTLAADGSATAILTKVDFRALERLPVTAVGYGPSKSGLAQLVTGRLNGAVFCGDQAITSKTRRDGSPVRTIVSHPDSGIFAASSANGEVLAGICGNNEKMYVFPATFRSSDPGSLRLAQVQSYSDQLPPWVVSFLDTDRQLRCYAYDPKLNQHQWWLCNAVHVIGSPVLMTEAGQQLVVERTGVSAIRQYPNEQLSIMGRQVNARQAGDSVVRWKDQVTVNVEKLKKGDESPWQVKDAVLEAQPGRQIEGAALSPNGKWVAWIERLRTSDHRDVVPEDIDPALRETVSLVRSMEMGKDSLPKPWARQHGLALAVAIDDAGNVAMVQGSTEGTGGASLRFSDHRPAVALDPRYGRAQCLEFSPDGTQLVLGTAGGTLLRYASVAGTRADKPAPLWRTEADAKRGVGGAKVTACAVANDGGVAAGYADGRVFAFTLDSMSRELTTRAVYGFPASIKDVHIDPPGPQRRVTALGEWQINDCVHSAMPGQTLRAWDLMLPDAQRVTPVASACFPNTAIAALGEWGFKRDDNTSDACPKTADKNMAATAAAEVGLCVITAQESRWHACPGCGRPGETPKEILDRVVDAAVRAGARPLSDAELEARYGFKLNVMQ